jgi:hypothetical protein
MEHGAGQDRLVINAGVFLNEVGKHSTRLTVEKWDIDQVNWVRKLARDAVPLAWEPDAETFDRLNVLPFDTYVKEDCNLITDAGWVNLMNGIAGTTPTKFVNGVTGRIGLGTSATAVTYTDTALNAIGALTTANWELINAVPVIGSTHATGFSIAATFPLNAANGVAIAEFAADFGTAATLSAAAVGGMFSHGNAAPGTKTASQVWNTIITYTWL